MFREKMAAKKLDIELMVTGTDESDEWTLFTQKNE